MSGPADTVAGSTALQGAKIALLQGDALVAYLRDDIPAIPNPGQWDLPGGVREAGETALDCALRETREEFGIDVPPAAIFHAGTYIAAANGPLTERAVAFFAARIPADLVARIVYGDEGQGWRMMQVAEFVSRPDAVAELRAAVGDLGRVAVTRPGGKTAEAARHVHDPLRLQPGGTTP